MLSWQGKQMNEPYYFLQSADRVYVHTSPDNLRMFILNFVLGLQRERIVSKKRSYGLIVNLYFFQESKVQG